MPLTLSRNRIQGDKLFLYTAKTGTPARCQRAECDSWEHRIVFLDGKSNAKNRSKSSAGKFILAGVPDGHAHRFRDTFSVRLLLAGVPIEHVSILLGHQSVRITEKHYAPSVRERQEQLEADVRRPWEPLNQYEGYTAGTRRNARA
jgi:integrase/recombinase XerD